MGALHHSHCGVLGSRAAGPASLPQAAVTPSGGVGTGSTRQPWREACHYKSCLLGTFSYLLKRGGTYVFDN